MLFVLAAGLLLVAVALLILRPLLAPYDTDRTGDPEERVRPIDDVTQPPEGMAQDPLEAAIAERRARMAERAGG